MHLFSPASYFLFVRQCQLLGVAALIGVGCISMPTATVNSSAMLSGSMWLLSSFGVYAFALVAISLWLKDRSLTFIVDDGCVIRRTTVGGLRESTVPVARVQTVSVHQGLLERWAGLFSVSLYTAAAKPLVLHGLSKQDADTLRDHVLSLMDAGRKHA